MYRNHVTDVRTSRPDFIGTRARDIWVVGRLLPPGCTVRKSTEEFIVLAQKHNINVVLFSRKRMREILCDDSKATKEDIAQMLVKQFPKELGSRLPPKRRPWMSEDSRMGIFDAVALGVVGWSKGRAGTG